MISESVLCGVVGKEGGREVDGVMRVGLVVYDWRRRCGRLLCFVGCVEMG